MTGYVQVLFPEPAPIVESRLRGQGQQDFLAVPGPLPSQHLPVDVVADMREQQRQFGIDCQGGALA